MFDSEGQCLNLAFRRCLGRAPTASEHRCLLDFVKAQERAFRKDPKAAAALVQVGSAPRPADLKDGPLAAWMTLANVLFNLDETLTKG